MGMEKGQSETESWRQKLKNRVKKNTKKIANIFSNNEKVITIQDRIRHLHDPEEKTHETIRYPFPEERKRNKLKKDIYERSILPLINQFSIEQIKYVMQDYVEPHSQDIIITFPAEGPSKSTISIEVTTGDTEIKLFPKTCSSELKDSIIAYAKIIKQTL